MEGDILKVFEISVLIYLLNDINTKECQKEICSFIDSGLVKNRKLKEFHNANTYKGYNFNSFYPLEKEGVYKQGNIYTIQIRTIDKLLADFFANDLVNHFNVNIKGLTSKIKIIPKKHIDKIYSITPVILKNEEGYWRGNLSLAEFERRLKENLIKKYNLAMKTKINEDFEIYTNIEFLNKKPVSMEYKEKTLLGDKISINISDDKTAQDLAYMALGTGLLEMNARGAGYVNFKWL